MDTGTDIMGKKGPCDHCGVEYTPLWRNGPPGKEVLCNACGSRWRTKGTLHNYIPKQALIRTSPDSNFDSPITFKRRKKSNLSGGINGQVIPDIRDKITKSEPSLFRNAEEVDVSAYSEPINGDATSDSGKSETEVDDENLTTFKKLNRDLCNILNDKENPISLVGTDGDLIYHKNEPYIMETNGCVLLHSSTEKNEL